MVALAFLYLFIALTAAVVALIASPEIAALAGTIAMLFAFCHVLGLLLALWTSSHRHSRRR